MSPCLSVWLALASSPLFFMASRFFCPWSTRPPPPRLWRRSYCTVEGDMIPVSYVLTPLGVLKQAVTAVVSYGTMLTNSNINYHHRLPQCRIEILILSYWCGTQAHSTCTIPVMHHPLPDGSHCALSVHRSAMSHEISL